MLTQKPWKPWEALMLMSPVLLPFILMMAIQATSTPEASNTTSETPQLTTAFVLTDLALHLGYTVLAVALLMRFHGIALNDVIGYRNGRLLRVIPLSIATGLLFVIFVVLYFFWYDLITSVTSTTQPDGQDVVRELKRATENAAPGTILVLLALPVVRAPIVEEFFFRGLLYPSIKDSGYPRLALWVTAILFALIHVNLRAFIPLVLLSMMLTWQYERSGNLLSPILTHATFNLINSLIIILVEFPPAN